MLPSFLHQRNRRRFVLSICPMPVGCCSTNCFVVICIHTKYCIQYGRRASRTWYLAVLLAAVRTSYVLLCPMADGNVFVCFQRFLYIQNCYLVFHDAPLGSTVALTASSCIPVRLQPLRVCAEPPAGVTLVVRTGSGQYQVRQGKSKVELQLSVLVSVSLALL